MDGVYQRDEEIMDMFSTEIEDLFGREIPLKPKLSEQFLEMAREA